MTRSDRHVDLPIAIRPSNPSISFDLASTAVRSLLVGIVFATALLFASPVIAQIGGPIGAPSGVPNGLPSGVSAYSSQGGRVAAPPVNNWSSNDAGRGAFGGRYDGGQSGRASPPPPSVLDEIPLPTVQHGRQTAPSASGTARDSRERADDFSPAQSRAAGALTAGKDDSGDRGTATRKIAAVEQSSVDALRDLVQKGQMHETGLGRQKNLGRAFSLYCEAARDGYPDALIRMGWMFVEGNGVEKSLSAASTLFKRAARFGSGVGDELAKRYPGDHEVLPVCLKGTLVEKGSAERPATAAELSAMAPKFSSPLVMRNSVISAERGKFVDTVIQQARSFKLDPRLVLAVMATESGFDPNAKSPKNAWGLMQLIPETAERFSVKDILDPVDNIRGGMAYLRWLLSYFRGDVTLTLAAYNAGERAVEKYGGVPPYAETLAYVQRIRALYPFDRHPYDATVSTSSSKAAPQPTRTVDAEAAIAAQPVVRN